MATPVLGSMSVDQDLRVVIPVVDLGGNHAARVDLAVSPTEPPQDSHLWLALPSITEPGTVTTVPQTPGVKVWIRASGRNAAGARTSAFTSAVSIQIVERADLTNVQLAIQHGIATVTWTPNALAKGVRLRWILHGPDDTPPEPSSEAHVEAEVGTFAVPDLIPFGDAVTVILEAWDGWNSGAQTVDGDEGGTVIVSATRERDPRDLSGFFLEADDGSRWRLVVGNSGELTTEPI